MSTSRLPITVAAAALLLLGAPSHAATTPPGDPALEQEISAEQPVVAGPHVLATGHVDLGPRLIDGEWTVLVHDDAARTDSGATSVWRYPDETVLQVTDAAQRTVPDDETYSFLGAEPGRPVWVVPQTQEPDVVWLGWNTQDPDVMAVVDRGVTMSLAGVQGPAPVTVYLQAGAFGEPEVLWDSRITEPQPVWVDVNTHTHANWVFTEPGVYLLALAVEADLLDGTTVSDTQVLRFAVGATTPPETALDARWSGALPSAGAAATGASGADEEEESRDGALPLLLVGVVAAALVIAVVILLLSLRDRRLRRRYLDGSGDPGPAEPVSQGDDAVRRAGSPSGPEGPGPVAGDR